MRLEKLYMIAALCLLCSTAAGKNGDLDESGLRANALQYREPRTSELYGRSLRAGPQDYAKEVPSARATWYGAIVIFLAGGYYISRRRRTG
jgi:hypothetical protein